MKTARPAQGLGGWQAARHRRRELAVEKAWEVLVRIVRNRRLPTDAFTLSGRIPGKVVPPARSSVTKAAASQRNRCGA